MAALYWCCATDLLLQLVPIDIQDAGQQRAFYVKFAGEGVDDHGGPYRVRKLGEKAWRNSKRARV